MGELSRDRPIAADGFKLDALAPSTAAPRPSTLVAPVALIAAVDRMSSAASLVGDPSVFPWLQEISFFSDHWSQDQSVLDSLAGFGGVALQGFSLPGLESIFRLRALQLLERQARLPIPSAVFVEDGADAAGLVPGFGRRVASSWPFRSVVFVADGAAAKALTAEGLCVVSASNAGEIGVQHLFDFPGSVLASVGQDQGIAVQTQPFWGRCGSSTAFANQIDALIDKGLFTIRVFIDHGMRIGRTATRRLAEILPENRVDSAPHLEAFAGAEGGSLRASTNEFEVFENSVRERARSTICDPVARNLAAKAEVVIVNRAASVGFAAQACPRAGLVLDTHDYLTRNALEVARFTDNKDAFPDRATLRQHLALERRLWRASDICTTVSLDEERRIRRSAESVLLVLPEPYDKPWTDPGPSAEWDVLIVADNHAFNVKSVTWFLEKVLSPNAFCHGLRIAIVGRVQNALEPIWSERLPNVKWLGYVPDLDRVRSASRLAICPEQEGTGISVKMLTALAASQPMVATSNTLRGLPDSVAKLIPTADDAVAMSRDILRLLDNAGEARARHLLMKHANEQLRRTYGYGLAIDASRMARASAAEARKALVAEFGDEVDRSPPPLTFDRQEATLAFNIGGSAEAFLGAGWHDAEVWGRWMDGDWATLRLPASSIASPTAIDIRFCTFQQPAGVSVSCGGAILTPDGLTTAAGSARVVIDPAMRDPGHETITIEITTDSTICPSDRPRNAHETGDRRVLGAGVESVTFLRKPGALDASALTISLGAEGNAEPFLGIGWYGPEPWGRWMHGASATLRFPTALVRSAAILDIRFRNHRGPVPISVACRGRILTAHGVTTQGGSVQVAVDPTLRDPETDVVTIELQAHTTVCPRDMGWNDDERTLGGAVESVTVRSLDNDRIAVQPKDPYAAWTLSTFGEEISGPGVIHAARFPEGSIWAQKAHEALLRVEVEYVESLLCDLRDADVPGALVEFGIFEGWWIDKLFDLSETAGLRRTIIGYDSFAGLSAPHPINDAAFWKEGQYAASLEAVAANVKLAERGRIQLIPGFFADSLTREPATAVGPIAFARIDCDIYEPTLQCLRYLAPRLSDGAVLVFDDWPHRLDVGEGRAFREWAVTVPSLRFEFLSYCTWGHFYMRVQRRG